MEEDSDEEPLPVRDEPPNDPIYDEPPNDPIYAEPPRDLVNDMIGNNPTYGVLVNSDQSINNVQSDPTQ